MKGVREQGFFEKKFFKKEKNQFKEKNCTGEKKET